MATADFGPTDQHTEVAQILSDQVDDVEAAFEAVLGEELADFNQLLQQKVGRVITTQ